jgi:hypothetical protein
VSIDGEYSDKILVTDLSVIEGDLYTKTVIWPRVTCRHFT